MTSKYTIFGVQRVPVLTDLPLGALAATVQILEAPCLVLCRDS
jgi:hypothetical protein